MRRRGDPITFRGLAQTAGVSLDFLYRTPEIRRQVEQLRAGQQARPAARTPAYGADQPGSVIRTLTAQLTELKRRHREETSALKQALEAAHGENLELRRRLGHQDTAARRPDRFSSRHDRKRSTSTNTQDEDLFPG